MAVYNSTPHHTTPHHTTPHPHSCLSLYRVNRPSLKSRIKNRIKQYKLIKYPYDIFIRPVKRAVHRAKAGTWNFMLTHEPFRSAVIRKNGYKLCRLSTVYDYCKEHDGILRVYDDSCEYPARPLCRTREEFETNSFAEPVMRPAWYIYVSKIRDAVIFGEEDLFVSEGVLLGDSKMQSNRYYISRNIPEIGAEHALVKIPSSPEVIESGINLLRMWSENLYHFSFEALARLQLVDTLKEYRNVPILVNESVLTNYWSLQLIDTVNIYNHPVIPLVRGKAYMVHEMIYPSFISWGGSEALWYAPRIHTMAADYLREKITAIHKPLRSYKNVYIPRGNNERLLNESEVIECLKKYGFEIIPQGADNYSQTLDAFMTADNIIGTMGASMSNTIAAKPDATIYIICPFEFQHDCPGIAVTDASRRRLRFIAADIQKLDHGISTTKLSGLNTSTFSVRIEKIEALAQQLSR